ncbi:uncharacterized protein LOC104884247 [Beta vulgaris subsp. vulgaris]|uniref:uncharacterized protein LOC104884247 n=1 Tax=Beta vulgaris subsp. vulgaris TaxID=3555 RepID=UPI00053F7A31|nr:uncharacterized protein LOC104884247 [Beta vulgaris subsp. vulgaris]
MPYSILLNDTLVVPFEAKRGLRQAYSLSPFLFALSMEYISRYLGDLQKNPGYNFRSKCERLKLTHLMFADDLRLFSRADRSSVTKLMVAFTKFSIANGVEASIDKSVIYISGVTEDMKAHFANSINIPTRTLPFKYLGVPLSSKKLNFSQSKLLIGKITARAQGWMAHLVSYARRHQIIRVYHS